MTDRERATGMAGQVQLAIGSGNWGRSAIVDMLVDFASTARAEERERYAGKAEVERDDYVACDGEVYAPLDAAMANDRCWRHSHRAASELGTLGSA